MKNETLYVPDKDETVWEKAQRYLHFYNNGESPSAHITNYLRQYVAKTEAKHGTTEKPK